MNLARKEDSFVSFHRISFGVSLHGPFVHNIRRRDKAWFHLIPGSQLSLLLDFN